MNIVEGKILNMCQEVGFQMYKEGEEYYVDAEDLWNWLGVKTYFTTWFDRRITTYKFEENIDYVILYYKEESKNDFKKNTNAKFGNSQNIENTRIINCENLKKLSEFTNDNQASRYGYKKKYFIKSDMAKYLAMVEDADKGKQVREFYLELEQFIQDANLTEEFKHYRKTGKTIRKDLTYIIKTKLQPSDKFVYSNYINLCYQTLYGVNATDIKTHLGLGKKDNLRDNLPAEHLEAIIKLEEEIKVYIITFKAMGFDNKKTFTSIKQLLKNYDIKLYL